MSKKILCLFLIISFLLPGLCFGHSNHEHHDHHDDYDDEIAIGLAIGAVVALAIVVLILRHRPKLLPPGMPVGFDQRKKNSTKFKLVLTPTYGGMRLEF